MKVLLVIDVQKDFVTHALANPAAQLVVPKIVERLKATEVNKEKIVFTKDTHETNYLSTLEGKLLPIEHCIRNTEGWELCDEMRPYMDPFNVITKDTFGCVDLPAFLCENYFRDLLGSDENVEIELCGFCTSICVLANAVILRANYPNLKITVNGNLCADITEESHKAALQVLKSQQINVIE